MAKVDRAEDLPEWFQLEKYRACEKFKAVDWFNCLSVRRGAWWVQHMALKHGFKAEEFCSTDTFRPYELMRTDPLNWSSVRFMHMSNKAVAGDMRLDTPVRALEFVDLLFQRQSDEEDKYEGRPNSRVESWRLFDNRNWMESMDGLDGVPVGTVNGCMETIKVDMNATDSVLIDAFAAWLKDARAKQPTTSKRERPPYKDWVRYGLLPYLDLLIWSKEAGNHIPHHVMAQAVGYRKGGDSFRKTVPKLAEELMLSLAELEALAAIEAASE